MEKLPLKPVHIFYSYAFQDRDMVKELDKHLALLKRSGTITSWDASMIMPGMQWMQEIEAQLEAADIILFFISSDLLASKSSYMAVMQSIKKMKKRE